MGQGRDALMQILADGELMLLAQSGGAATEAALHRQEAQVRSSVKVACQ